MSFFYIWKFCKQKGKIEWKSGEKKGKTGGKMSDMGIDGRVKVNDRHVHTKKPEHCEKALCCHNCSEKPWEKMVLV